MCAFSEFPQVRCKPGLFLEPPPPPVPNLPHPHSSPPRATKFVDLCRSSYQAARRSPGCRLKWARRIWFRTASKRLPPASKVRSNQATDRGGPRTSWPARVSKSVHSSSLESLWCGGGLLRARHSSFSFRTGPSFAAYNPWRQEVAARSAWTSARREDDKTLCSGRNGRLRKNGLACHGEIAEFRFRVAIRRRTVS